MVLAKNPGRPEPLVKYIDAHNNLHPAQIGLYNATSAHEMERWQMPLSQASFLRWIIADPDKKMKNTLDVGVFTGGSSLAAALALPEDGKVTACDINSENVKIGRPFWEQAGVAHKIDFREGKATDTLQALIDEGQAGKFDFAFVDANKDDYPTYFRQIGSLLRVGGIVAIDNVFWHGDRVVDPSYNDPDTLAVREVNDMLTSSASFDQVMVPISDGLFLGRKVA